MNQEKIKKNFEEFFKGLETCPICGKKMVECSHMIIKKARDSTILMTCPNCEILIGRYS